MGQSEMFGSLSFDKQENWPPIRPTCLPLPYTMFLMLLFIPFGCIPWIFIALFPSKHAHLVLKWSLSASPQSHHSTSKPKCIATGHGRINIWIINRPLQTFIPYLYEIALPNAAGSVGRKVIKVCSIHTTRVTRTRPMSS